MPRDYFRAMTPTEGERPVLGANKRALGALANETTDITGTFGPGTGGMSVSPDSPWFVPHHRRPRGMGRGSTGPVQDWIFAIGDPALDSASLSARLDPQSPERHAFIEPVTRLTFGDYNAALAATQAAWRRFWP
jgi:hypothetical protein